MEYPGRPLKKGQNNFFNPNKLRRNSSTHSIKETYKIIKGRDHEGRTTINQYTFVKKLGEGAFSKVKLAVKHDTSEKFAIKIFRKSFLKKKKEYIKDEKGMKVKDALQDVLREIAIMKKLDHMNVIKLHEVIDDPEEDQFFMILDYAEKGQMIDWDEKQERFCLTPQYIFHELNEDFLRKTFRDIIKGLYYLHNNGIIHRDLKPQNIVFNEENIAKIGDFGVSYLMEDLKDDKLKSSAGTYHFMAPESCNPVTKRNGYSGKRADIWGLGITLFSFVFCQIPFGGDDVCELLDNIENQTLKFPESRNISLELKNLLTQLLEKDPEKRITMKDILEDEWLNKGCEKLKTEIDHDIVEITDSDIKNALIPLHTIVFLKKFVKNWRERSSSRSNSPQSEGATPVHSPPQNMRRSGKSVYSKLNLNSLDMNNKKINSKESLRKSSNHSHSKKSPLREEEDADNCFKLITPLMQNKSPLLRTMVVADNQDLKTPTIMKSAKSPTLKSPKLRSPKLKSPKKIDEDHCEIGKIYEFH